MGRYEVDIRFDTATVERVASRFPEENVEVTVVGRFEINGVPMAWKETAISDPNEAYLSASDLRFKIYHQVKSLFKAPAGALETLPEGDSEEVA